MTDAYVHGYSSDEAQRLHRQARTLADLIHGGTHYPPHAHVLEAGCGTGEQTLELARRSPGARFTSIDRSAASVTHARQRLEAAGVRNVVCREADLFELPFEAGAFDHVFLCFVLEHLPDPAAALRALARSVRPGGTVTVIEGDHGTACFHPETSAAREAVGCLVELQRRSGGDALIGRRLHPLLASAGLQDVRVEPRMVLADAGRPDLAASFTLGTFTAMVAGVRTTALAHGLTTPQRFDEGIRDLSRTAEPDGTFAYAFFKATATVR